MSYYRFEAKIYTRYCKYTSNNKNELILDQKFIFMLFANFRVFAIAILRLMVYH